MKHAIYIRWLGAFRGKKEHTLLESLNYECSQRQNHEVACEMLLPHKNIGGKPTFFSDINCKVGLLIDSSCIIRRFNSDCWSEYGSHKKEWYKLHATRTKSRFTHTEAWAQSPIIKAIVINNNGQRLCNCRNMVQDAVSSTSHSYNIPIYYLNRNGELLPDCSFGE